MIPVRLYIKRHSLTGLMYFGKTIKDDVSSYLGSGILWSRHINKYGADHVETLWVSDPFTNREELIDFAQLFSEHFDIVGSDRWANLVVENGVTGGAIRAGAILSEDTKEKIRVKALGRTASDHTKQKMSKARKGRLQTEAQKQAMREYNASRSLPPASCPHCNKQGSYVAMHRWHFERCKSKEN